MIQGVFLILLFLFPSIAHGDINTGLVAWWRFTEGSGATTKDSTGNGYTGTLQNTPTWVTGHINPNALSFVSASSQYVSVNNITQLNGAAGMTVSAWVNTSNCAPGGGGTTSTIMREQDSVTTSNSDFAFGCGWTARKARFYVWVGGSAFNSGDSTSNLDDGNWHMVTGVYDGSNIYIYFDGSSQSSTAKSGSLTSSNIGAGIGAYSTGVNEYWQGKIDDVRVYSRGLSASDVTELY